MNFSEWSNSKKKKKEQASSFSEWSNDKYGKPTTVRQEDIAPVKTTTTATRQDNSLEEKLNKATELYDRIEEKRKAMELSKKYSGRNGYQYKTEKEDRERLTVAEAEYNNYLKKIGYKSLDELKTAYNQTKTTTDKRTWFQKGALEDGVTVGNVAKGVSATTKDVQTNVWGGILNIGEALVDAGAVLGTKMVSAENERTKHSANILKMALGIDTSDLLKQIDDDTNKLKKDTAEFVKKDLYDGVEIAKKIISDPYEKITGINVEENSFLGEKSDELVQSGGQMAAQIGVSLIPYVGTAVATTMMAGTAFGSEAENAFNNDATFDEAFLSATISAAAEVVTEKLGGVKLSGGKSLVDVVTQPLAKRFSSKLGTALVKVGKIGLDATAEGIEEVVSGYASAIGQQMTYMEEKEIEELFSSEEALDSFIGGFVLGGVGGVTESAAQGKGYVTGMTKNEQAVFDKVYNDAIAEAEKDGKTLTSKEKAEIYDNILENMEHGEISIDTIEEVLGGEDYAEYKKYADFSEGLTNEINELGSKTTPTLADQYKYPTLQKRLEETKAKKDSARAKLDEKMLSVLGNDRLVESYNEVAKRKEAFKADLTQYDEKQRKAVERAVKSGVLNNTRMSHLLVNTLSRIEADKGIVFDYTNNENLKKSGFAINGKTINGFVKDGNVTLNVQSSKSWQSVVGHEITHVLEGTDAYSELQRVLFEVAESKGELESRRAELTELYKKMDADIDAELTADLIGDYLFGNKDFINKLAGNKKTFRAVYNEIKYLCKVATGKELTQMEKVREEFDKAWKELSDKGIDTVVENAKKGVDEETSDSNVKFSIREEAPPKETGIAYKVFFVKDGKLYPPMVANPDGADTPMGVWLNADVGTAAPPSKTGRAQVKAGGKGTQGGSGSLAFRPGWHLGDLPRASQFDRVNPETGKKELFPENFVWAEVEYAKDVDYQEEAMSYGYTENGKFRHAYAGLPKLPENGYYRYRTNPKPDTVPWVITGAMKVNRLLSDAEVNEILEKNDVPAVHRQGGDVGLDKFGFDESGKVKYSVSTDSQGNELSIAVQKRFANSKAVDENGNLKVLYHGTASGEFFTFDKAKGSVEGDFGSGFYFTDNEYDVERNYEGGGADFENKVARRAEQIAAEEEIDYSEAEKRAREELYKGSNKFEVYLNIENPAIVGETNLFDYESYAENYDRDDYDSDEDYEGDIEQLIADDIDQIIWDIDRNVDIYSTDGIAEVLWNAVNEGGIDIEQLKANINNLYLEDSNGNLVGNEVTRQIIESLGYDGIIDNTVSTKFNMELEEGTTHYIVSKPNQIKSIDNQNPTDNPDIRYSLSENGQNFNKNLENAGKILYNSNNPLSIVDRAKSNNSSSINWVYKAEIFSVTENKLFHEKISEINQGSQAFQKNSIDEYMIPIENKIIFTNGNYDSPYIREVIEVLTESQTEFEDIKRCVFSVEKGESSKQDAARIIRQMYGDGIVISYNSRNNGVYGWENRKRKGKTRQTVVRNYLNKLYGRGNDSQINETTADLNGSASFMPENIAPTKNSLSNVGEKSSSVGTPLKDLALEQDIAPVANSPERVTIPKSAVSNDVPFPNEIHPMSEEEANALQDEKAQSDAVTSLEAIQTELENVKEFRTDAFAKFEQKIANKQAELDSKKNKDTKVVNNLKMQIERLKRLRDSTDADYSKRIDKLTTMEKLAREGKPTSRQEHHNNIIKGIKTELANRGIDMDDMLNSAKRMHTITINDNTPQRVNDKTFGYEAGEALNELMLNKVALNESKATVWMNEQVATLKELSKKYGIKPRSKASAAAQMYAEGFSVDENNEIVPYGDAELVRDFPDVKVRHSIKALALDPAIRQIYDNTLDAINESRTRNAYPEIPRRDNYFLHFREMDDTFSKLGIPFNPNDIKAKDLPTDINGRTADNKPGQSYFTSAMQRKGMRTSFDLLGGVERYLKSASPQIFHLDDIQTERAMWGYIAERFGQAEGLENLDLMDAAEQQEHIKKVYDGHLSNYARFLNEHANHLAGKTALMDRTLEGIIGRRGLEVVNTINSQTGKNQVGFNVSSAATNFIPTMETIARTNKQDSIKAFAQMVANVFRKDGFVNNDPALIRRKGTDRFAKTPWEKVSDAGYFLMSAVDNISSEFIVRTKYNELTRKGMDSEQAHVKAGEWAMRIMGDRSLGQMPLNYNAKTLGIITKYQLEVRNLLDSQFYDVAQEAKMSTKDIENQLEKNAKTAGKIAWKTFQIALLNHVFGQTFEKVAGYNPAFDIISTISKLFGWDDDEESEDTFGDNIEQAFQELLGDLPYTNLITNGGRIPMADAFPIKELVSNQDDYGQPIADGEWGWLTGRAKTIAKTLPYALPGGYGQIKKTYQGLSMFSDEHPVTGSYTDSGNLRFPVEDTLGNRIQAGLFGQYASENAREYFDNDYAPLKEKQIQEYIDVDMPIKDYWEYREGLAEQEKLEDKLDYISGLDLPISKKNILANNVTDRKEPIDLTNYDDFSSLEEFDYATKNPEKYAFAKSVGGYSAYKTYSGELYDIKADKDANGKSISGSRKTKVVDYINNLDADYYTKIILYKSEYPSDDTYNTEIINYINNRGGLTYDEKISIFTELGFRVSNGYVYQY